MIAPCVVSLLIFSVSELRTAILITNKTLHWLSNCRAKSACPVSLPWNSLPRQVEVWEKSVKTAVVVPT
jgi:hypothetical protein